MRSYHRNANCRFSFPAAALLVLLLALSSSASAESVASVLQDGADRVVGLQHTDGQWGYRLTAPPTYSNISGPIGMGLVAAHARTNDSDHLNSAKAAGNALVGQSADWIGTQNPEFLIKLSDATPASDLTASNSYQPQATSFFTDLAAGTYTRRDVDYDTDEWISKIQSDRSGDLQNYEAWDFAPQAIAANRVGTNGQKNKFIQAVKDGIDGLDDSKQLDVLGLAGGIRAFGLLGVDFNPTSGAYASAVSTDDLADILANLQNPDGSWSHSSNGINRSTYDESITANAMLALLELNDSGSFNEELLLGREYLVNSQQANGGWLNPDGYEYVQVNGENLNALAGAAAVPVPTPAAGALGLVGFGLLALRRRRRNETV